MLKLIVVLIRWWLAAVQVNWRWRKPRNYTTTRNGKGGREGGNPNLDKNALLLWSGGTMAALWVWQHRGVFPPLLLFGWASWPEFELRFCCDTARCSRLIQELRQRTPHIGLLFSAQTLGAWFGCESELFQWELWKVSTISSSIC